MFILKKTFLSLYLIVTQQQYCLITMYGCIVCNIIKLKLLDKKRVSDYKETTVLLHHCDR